jgi:hypothetical protein
MLLAPQLWLLGLFRWLPSGIRGCRFVGGRSPGEGHESAATRAGMIGSLVLPSASCRGPRRFPAPARRIRPLFAGSLS